jgi:hypothetical protein
LVRSSKSAPTCGVCVCVCVYMRAYVSVRACACACMQLYREITIGASRWQPSPSVAHACARTSARTMLHERTDCGTATRHSSSRRRIACVIWMRAEHHFCSPIAGHTAQPRGGSLQHSDAAARRVGRLRGRCVVTPACLAGMTGSRRSSSLCAIGRTSAAGCCHSGARTSCSSSRTTGASNAVAAGYAPLQNALVRCNVRCSAQCQAHAPWHD